MTTVINDDDLAYVLDTVAALHQIDHAALRFDFHVDADSVLHLINRDPITALVLHVVAPSHTSEMVGALTLTRFDLAGLAGRRRCQECITSNVMLFEAITEYDVAVSTSSLATANALVPIPEELDEFATRGHTAESVMRFTDVYDALVYRTMNELEHLAHPAAFARGDVLDDAYRRVEARLDQIHASTLGTEAMRSLLRGEANTSYGITSGDAGVLVELAALSDEEIDDTEPDASAKAALRLATAVQIVYAPQTRDDHRVVMLPEWAAAVIEEHAGHRIRSRVFTGLGTTEVDTATRLWEPHGSGLYRSLEHCVNAAIALR